jgi:alpha-tubulin suppressor-like RCC1 family protein
MCNMVACDPSPGVVGGISGAVQVSAGGAYACARTATGSVACWGDNSYGQLGTGDFMATGIAGATRPALGVTQAVDVSASLAGASTCAATTGGTVLCWGRDDQGGVGRASTTGDPKSMDMVSCVLTAEAVSTIKGAVTVRSGGLAGCAETMSGTVPSFSCWGYDGLGCLGSASMATVGLPPAAVTVVPGLAALDLRDTTACGVDALGNAWCWGQSGYGALGPEAMLAANCANNTPCLRTAQKVGRGAVAQIATGANLSLALLDDGTVWAWGVNADGRLGHPPGMLKDAPCLANNTLLCNGTPNPVQGLPQ